MTTLPRGRSEKSLVGVLVTLLIWIPLVTGCTKPARRGELLERYSRAQCIPVRLAAESPSTREWDHRIITRAAGAVTVRGAQGPGGRITAIFASEQEPRVVASSIDYIYPSDVRFDAANDLLYVKTSGVTAALARPETWLFEYDLNQRLEIRRLLVDASVLPPECPVTTR